MFVSVEVRSGDVPASAGTRRWARPHALTGVLASEEPVGYDADRAPDADADADAAAWTGDAAAGTPWTETPGGGDATSTTVDDGHDAAFDTETVDDNDEHDGETVDGNGQHDSGAGGGDGAGGWVVGTAPRTVEARTRLTRCATTPGSPLGAAVGALADAVEALTATATTDMAGTADPAGAMDGADPAGTAAW
ncbi:MAG: hypothetical protein WD250_15550, partial [Egibacteraceae bacterium]